MQEQMSKQFNETEEYAQLIAQLNEKENELQEKDKQMEIMYNQIVSFDEEKKAIQNEGTKGNDELNELKTKYSELENLYDESQKELAEIQKE